MSLGIHFREAQKAWMTLLGKQVGRDRSVDMDFMFILYPHNCHFIEGKGR